MLKTWRAFWRLNASEKSLVLESGALLATTWLALRLLGFRLWRAWMARVGQSAADLPASVSHESLVRSAASAARLQASAARHFPIVTNCLDNSFALYWLLRRRGVPANLRIGARKVNDRLEAHAWVECRGLILGEASEKHLQFAPLVGRDASMESQIP